MGLLQTSFRIYQAEKDFKTARSSAIEIQRIWLGAIQRPRYHDLLEEAKEDARVNTKLSALQKRLASAEMKWIQSEKARIEAEKRASESSSSTGEEKKEETSQSLLDESTQMLEYLQKQVFEQRAKNFLLRNDLSELKIENHHLADQYASASASYVALKQHTASQTRSTMKTNVRAAENKKQLGQILKDLQKSREDHEEDVKKLKEDVRQKDANHAQELFRMRKEMDSLQAKHNYEQRRHRVHKPPPGNPSQSVGKTINNRSKFTRKKSNGGNDDWSHDGHSLMHSGEHSVSSAGSSRRKGRKKNAPKNRTNPTNVSQRPGTAPLQNQRPATAPYTNSYNNSMPRPGTASTLGLGSQTSPSSGRQGQGRTMLPEGSRSCISEAWSSTPPSLRSAAKKLSSLAKATVKD